MARRLLVLTPDFPPAVGGIQRLLWETTTRLQGIWDVTVAAPSLPGAAALDAAAPVRVVRTRARWGGRSSAAVLAELAVVTRRARPDVVLAAHLVVLPAAAAAPSSARRIGYLYGGELWSPRAPTLVRRFGRRVERWLAISEFTANEAKAAGIDPSTVAVVPPGAATREVPDDWRDRLEKLGVDPAEPYLLTVGRLVEPHKGHDTLIRVLPPLVARHPRLRYVVTGSGPLEPRLRAIADAAGIQRAVMFAGVVDEALKSTLMRGCRAYAMVSRESRGAGQFEGFGITYIEAATVGRPSLGSDAGAVPEAVIHGETGLLADPSSRAAITENALRLLEDAAYADELGARARDRAEREFTWERSAQRVAAAIDDLAPH